MMPHQLNPKPFIAEAEVDAADREYTPTTSIRELTNEFGHKIKIFVREMVDNHIKITIEGPNSTSENILTPREFGQLRSALLDYNMTSNLTRTDLMDSDYARDVMKIEPVGGKAGEPVAITDEMVKALKFYANPENWIDTPSWDCDPTCFTPKAIPVTKQEDGCQPCDCGDVARAALASLNEAETNAPLRSRSLTEDEALLYQEITALLMRLRGPIFGTPTTERAADVIEKLQTALRTLADQKLSSEMDGHEYINADFEGAYNSLIELARAASASDTAAVSVISVIGALV
ncbi:hypothetical protein [Mesorhizobium sp.]|uniref:hypothetical protein n=1 Tax=Mesorhizobium sp. TaxID=1871066 RepID=UPI000FE8D96C|nr:hypothetical protein [Mesorhizobium sp.]RWE37449.1 MAG: hypothetical protein EOS77_02395 [Mesorhizobium sp.]